MGERADKAGVTGDLGISSSPEKARRRVMRGEVLRKERRGLPIGWEVRRVREVNLRNFAPS